MTIFPFLCGGGWDGEEKSYLQTKIFIYTVTYTASVELVGFWVFYKFLCKSIKF